MPKLIELEADGVTVVAALHEDLAPKAVGRLWEVLPLENQVSFYVPGTIGYRPEHGELAFSYGQAQARSLVGNGWATHCATLHGELGPFLQTLQRTQREGAKRLVIRR